MNINLSKTVVISFSMLLLTLNTGPSYADKHQTQFEFVNFEAYMQAGGDKNIAAAFEKVLGAFRAKAKSSEDSTVTSVLSQCNANLKGAGYEISSILITPTDAGGAGANARSLGPGEYLTKSCQIDSNNIEVCIIISLPDE